jgi:zinc ribbon protein
MPKAVGSSQEYWRSPNPEVMRLVSSEPAEAPCWHCGADYSPAAHFCHICGSPRDGELSASARGPQTASNFADLAGTRWALALSVAARVFFVLGVACILAAAVTGVIYKTDTLIDWQAVQLWRIEWLLAASAALLAGIFLKRNV